MLKVINDLLHNLPTGILITDKEQNVVFECDGLSAYRQIPLAVALPTNIEQIKTILTICRKYNTPIVTRGAGTGLSGGALPLEKGILLVLSKFNKILTIDPLQRIHK
jgi:glycolate oxidase